MRMNPFRRTRSTARTLLATACAGALVAVVAPATASAQDEPCTPIQVISARGTGEPGTLGVIVGEPILAQLQAEFPGKVSGYAVNYPAAITAESPQIGNRDLVEHYAAQRARCPNQSFVLVGYSQGANVVQMAMGTDADYLPVGNVSVAKIPEADTYQISAVLLFGNPMRKTARQDAGVVQNRVFDFCNPGDVICDPAGSAIEPHILYAPSFPQAVTQASDFLRRACTGLLGQFKGCLGAL